MDRTSEYVDQVRIALDVMLGSISEFESRARLCKIYYLMGGKTPLFDHEKRIVMKAITDGINMDLSIDDVIKKAKLAIDEYRQNMSKLQRRRRARR